MTALLTFVLATVAFAAPLTVESGASRAALVELYTSEGCSSCPPADRWLTSLRPRAARGELIPLSLHVDYWNYIGWSDPFSDPRFGERQRASAARAGTERVYTPEVFVDGKELTGRAALDGAIAAIARSPAAARLRLEVTTDGDGWRATVRAALAPGRRGHLFVVIYENELVSEVRAGENRGQSLRHDFVVRRLVGPRAVDGEVTLTEHLARDARWNPRSLGCVVFVQAESGEVLQAVRLPLGERG